MPKKYPYRKAQDLYFISLGLLLASLPLSKFSMSVSQFLLAGSWLMVGAAEIPESEDKAAAVGSFIRFKHILSAISRTVAGKLVSIRSNKTAIAALSLYFLFVLGLLYTSDFRYAFNDLQIKIPLLLLPVIISTGPDISGKAAVRLLLVYIAAISISAVYQFILFSNSDKLDVREIPSHLSHIRYSMNAVFGIAVSLYLVGTKQVNRKSLQVALLVNALLILVFLMYMGYTTGILLSLLVAFGLLIRWVIRNHSARRSILLVSLILLVPGFAISLWYSDITARPPAVSFDTLEKYTLNGNSYYHDTIHFPVENKEFTGLYICSRELETGWKSRSQVALNGLDARYQPVKSTLVRYLASSGLRKDSVGISKLSDKDIRNIESGLANRKLLNRLNAAAAVENFATAFNDYRLNDNPNGNSLVQRFEYWRTALQIIRKNWITGVGTGDVGDAFKKQYEADNSRLLDKFRLRAHDQYLTMFITFGFAGLAFFLFSLFYPALRTRKICSFYYFVFLLIMLLSMLTEDTLESQEGVTFYALFNALLIWGMERRKDD
jgi:hypothetical protein